MLLLQARIPSDVLSVSNNVLHFDPCIFFADDDHSFFAFGELIRLNAAGSFKMCLDFDLTDDSEIEGTESFTLQLEPDPGFTPDNILVSPAAEFATIFIRDNDGMLFIIMCVDHDSTVQH